MHDIPRHDSHRQWVPPPPREPRSLEARQQYSRIEPGRQDQRKGQRHRTVGAILLRPLGRRIDCSVKLGAFVHYLLSLSRVPARRCLLSCRVLWVTRPSSWRGAPAPLRGFVSLTRSYSSGFCKNVGTAESPCGVRNWRDETSERSPPERVTGDAPTRAPAGDGSPGGVAALATVLDTEPAD